MGEKNGGGNAIGKDRLTFS